MKLGQLTRIITALCPADGDVFDPFCGCVSIIAAAPKNSPQRALVADAIQDILAHASSRT